MVIVKILEEVEFMNVKGRVLEQVPRFVISVGIPHMVLNPNETSLVIENPQSPGSSLPDRSSSSRSKIEHTVTAWEEVVPIIDTDRFG